MQAQLALFLGKHAAKVLGAFHEIQGNLFQGQDNGENNMDNWNNAQGREIAKELIHEYGIKVTAAFNPDVCDLIAEKVHQRMKAGKLITHPSDSRRYDTKNKSGTTTGQAALVSNSAKSSTLTATFTKPDTPQTPSQNFSDMIRQKYKTQQAKSNEKFNQIFKWHSSTPKSENGHWVTMNGAHVFIEDK